MKEKFQLSTEKARLEAVINLDATPGQMGDMLQVNSFKKHLQKMLIEKK